MGKFIETILDQHLFSIVDLLADEGCLMVPGGIIVDERGISIGIPSRSDYDDKEIIEIISRSKILHNLHTTFQDRGYSSEAELDEELFKGYFSYFLGGVGVTGRSLSDVQREFPSLVEKLVKVKGQVIFLGNGTSTVPVELIERNSDITKIVLVDLFDPDTVVNQINTIERILRGKGYPLRNDLAYARSNLNRIRQTSNATYRRAFVGIDDINDLYGQFDAVVNIFGPGKSSQIENYLLNRDNQSAQILSTYQYNISSNILPVF